jgi:hypothetical protein
VGGVVIHASVSGGGGGPDGRPQASDFTLTDENGHELQLKVKHHQGACAPCRANEDPFNIPCVECNGNIGLKDPDEGIGNLCNCTVQLVPKGENPDDRVDDL